jgi:hypothetical protein
VFIIDFAAGLTGTNSQGQDWMAPITGIRSVYLPNTNAGWSVSVPSMDVLIPGMPEITEKVSFIDSAYADEDLTEKIGYDRFAPNHGSPRPHIGKFYRLAGNHRVTEVIPTTITRHLGMLRYC